jgi:hypothetical protein
MGWVPWHSDLTVESGGVGCTFGPSFTTVSPYAAIVFCSWWTFNLKRSASKVCSISRDSSWELVGSVLAATSKRSDSSQSGAPRILSSVTPYAAEMRVRSVVLVIISRPFLKLAEGWPEELALTDATSKAGGTEGACPKAGIDKRNTTLAHTTERITCRMTVHQGPGVQAKGPNH